MGGILMVFVGRVAGGGECLCSPHPCLGSGPRVGGGHLNGSVEERQLLGLEYK